MKPIICAVFLFLASTLLGADTFRTFTDSQGREMSAKVTRVSGDEVSIQRKDGLSTRVPINVFSQVDQDYIRAWESENFLKSGIVEVRFAEDEGDETKGSSGGIRSVTYDANYEVILKNTSDRPVKDIRVEYLMLKFTDEVAAKKRSAGQQERQKGQLELASLAGRTESRLATKKFSMRETSLEPGWTWAGGEAGKARESKDKLEGIWVKVYSGDLLILETARPESLMRKEPW